MQSSTSKDAFVWHGRLLCSEAPFACGSDQANVQGSGTEIGNSFSYEGYKEAAHKATLASLIVAERIPIGSPWTAFNRTAGEVNAHIHRQLPIRSVYVLDSLT